jgi:hypothetical protein
MYLRHTTFTKNGTSHTYWRLVLCYASSHARDAITILAPVSP